MIFLKLNGKSNRKPWSWTDRKEGRAENLLHLINELEEYWPLTVRQVFYRLISSALIKMGHWFWKGKRVNAYTAIGRTLKWMRIDDRIPMEAITDEHRIMTQKVGYTDPKQFIATKLHYLGNGYSRCNAQKQKRHVEVWIEKATLLHIVEPVADEFCRRVVVCRGYNSVTFQAAFYERAMEAISYGQIPTVLYFGDWDPSGENMILAAMETIEKELGLKGVEFVRCGINPDQFHEIPADPVPIKMTDTRSKKFIEQYGSTAYELDAFHPKRLQELVRESLEAFTDLDAYQEQLEQGAQDKKDLKQWVSKVKDVAYDTAYDLQMI